MDTDSTSLDDHRYNLDLLLENRGLRRIPTNESSFIYDDIVFQWLAQGRLEFTRNDFWEACRRENLFAQDGKPPVVFGVKSFEHAFDRLEDRCTTVLDLISHFDERTVRSQQEWGSDALPEARRVSSERRQRRTAHLSCSRCAHHVGVCGGAVLDIKSGRNVQIEQRTMQRQVWDAADLASDPRWSHWQYDIDKLSEGAGEMAVAISLTHDVAPAVKAFIANALPSVGTLLIARPSCGPSARSIACGHTHLISLNR